MMEFDYTLGLNEHTLPGMDKMITTCSSAMEAVKVGVVQPWCMVYVVVSSIPSIPSVQANLALPNSLPHFPPFPPVYCRTRTPSR